MNVQVDRNDCRNTSCTGITAGEDAAVARAVAHRDNPFGMRSGLISAFEGFAQIAGHRSCHEEDIGVARRSDKTYSESFQIVKDVAERMNLEFAAIA